VTKPKSPWAGAPYVWVWLGRLFETVESELGVSPFEARKVLIPDLVNLHIHAQLPALNDHYTLWEFFSREGLATQERYDEAPRVTPKGWAVMTRDGRFDDHILGSPVRVRWKHVVDALTGTRARLARESGAPAAETLKPPRKPVGRNYADADRPLVERMRQMLDSGDASSCYDAALAVAEDAVGGGTPVSKAKRLAIHYSAVFSSERN